MRQEPLVSVLLPARDAERWIGRALDSVRRQTEGRFECLVVDDGSVDEIMGVRHKQYAIEGVQFHPESILTEHGHDLLANFLKLK